MPHKKLIRIQDQTEKDYGKFSYRYSPVRKSRFFLKYCLLGQKLGALKVENNEEVYLVINLLSTKYNTYPSIIFKKRRILGRANFSLKEIEFTVFGLNFMTVIHEYVHILGYKKHDRVFFEKCSELANFVYKEMSDFFDKKFEVTKEVKNNERNNTLQGVV